MQNPIVIFTFLLIHLAALGQTDRDGFVMDYHPEKCTFLTSGKNTYFILEPGYRLKLESSDGEETETLVITVTDETKMVGKVLTRVVEEYESENGEVIEISRNYFAFCKETGDIYYFGEDVDIYEDGEVISHSGAWLAEGENKAGIIMPGMVAKGMKYYQEIAPGIAMDRAENTSVKETVETPVGIFTDVLATLETSPLEPGSQSIKMYAPNIGIIQDDDLVIIEYGFMK